MLQKKTCTAYLSQMTFRTGVLPRPSQERAAGVAGNALLQTEKFFEYHCTVRCLS
ncbi:hypothetical protein C7426_11225 [Pantoea ananatis]|nr:hypothetical protein C7426_11225 [Pantoea ananatis]